MAQLPTAEELDLFDEDVPEDMALSVFPFAQEHVEDPFWYDQGGRNPFHRKKVHKMSAGEERKQKLKEILQEFPRYGPKMFEWAVEQNDPELLKELFEIGASLDIKQAKGERTSDAAIDNSDGKGEAETDYSGAENDDNEDQEDDEAEDDDFPTVNMEPALHLAAFKGKLECLKVLVETGRADVNEKDAFDSTALRNALIGGHEEVVEWLLNHGANFDFETQSRPNDVRAALRSSKVALVKKVLESQQAKDANVQITTSDLAYAAWSTGEPTENIRFVLQCDCFSGPVTQIQKDAIMQALPYAIQGGSIESVRLMLPYVTQKKEGGTFDLVELPKDQEEQAFTIFNALEDAMKVKDVPDLFELVWETFLCGEQVWDDAYGDPTIDREDRLHRRLISSCSEGCVETCKLIVEKYGANVNYVSHKYLTTPLSRASSSVRNPLERRLPVVRYLLHEKHANIQLATGEFSNGATALACLLESPRGQQDMVKLLLEHGGPLEAINPDVVEVVEGSEAQAILKFYLVLEFGDRYPVTLMTTEQLSDGDIGSIESKVEIEANKEDWQKWLGSMQIRKPDDILGSEDPKSRPCA